MSSSTSTPSDQQILEDFSRVSISLIVGDPTKEIYGEAFFGHYFTGLIKKVTTRVQTLAVAYDQGLIKLYINPNFWTYDLPNLHVKIGAVKHELLHLVFKHVFRHEEFQDKSLYNLAADLVVNQYVKANQLIEGAITLDRFPELELAPHQHLQYYYRQLLDFMEDMPSQEEAPDHQSRDLLNSLLNPENAHQQKHIYWDDVSSLSSAERDLAESMINQALENSLQRVKTEDFGHLPAQLAKYLNDFREQLKPNLNWKRTLRLFSSNSRKTQIKNTIRRPSKRYGVSPGIKVVKKQNLMIAIDTSGSIQKGELEAFFNEINHIWKQGVQIIIVECDVKISQEYLYNGQTPTLVRGGGGTSFEAPILYANQVLKPDALIYFTDAFGPAPVNRCHCPVLWLVSSKGAELERLSEFPGRKVKMLALT